MSAKTPKLTTSFSFPEINFHQSVWLDVFFAYSTQEKNRISSRLFSFVLSNFYSSFESRWRLETKLIWWFTITFTTFCVPLDTPKFYHFPPSYEAVWGCNKLFTNLCEVRHTWCVICMQSDAKNRHASSSWNIKASSLSLAQGCCSIIFIFLFFCHYMVIVCAIEKFIYLFLWAKCRIYIRMNLFTIAWGACTLSKTVTKFFKEGVAHCIIIGWIGYDLCFSSAKKNNVATWWH